MTDLIQSYKRWWRGAGRSEETVEIYGYTLRRLAERLTPRPLTRAAYADLRDYLADRLDEVTAATVSVEFRALRSFYAWLEAEGEIDENPAERLRGPKVPETAVRVATESDFRQLLATCSKKTGVGRRNAAVLAMLWHCGMRRGELAALDLDNVDLDAGIVTIGRTKTAKPRRVPLHPEAAGILDRWLRHRGYSPGPLFGSARGGRLTSNGVGRIMESTREAAGIEITSHAFRRALATRWLREGGSENGLMAIAGWSTPSMVGRYTRMNREDLAHDEYRRLLG